MFPYILVILSIGTGEPPEAVASFKTQQGCKALADTLNKGTAEHKLVCITAIKNGDI